MKCNVVFDKDRKIVSVGYIDRPDLESYDYLTPRMGPEAEADQTVVELDVPQEYLRLPITDLVERLQTEFLSRK